MSTKKQRQLDRPQHNTQTTNTKEKEKTMKNQSILTKNQKKNFRADWTDANGAHVLIAQVRHDDECGNGHNTFSITGTLYGKRGDRRDESETTKNGDVLYVESCGCIHEEIAKRIPALAPFLKWHLTSTDEPLHYITNTIYLAGDRDWKLRKKARELEAARRSALWPEATDADLMQETEALRAALVARHPALMAEFRAAVESLGFIY